MRSIEWDSCEQLRHLRGHSPCDAATETETRHTDAVMDDKWLPFERSPAALEILDELVGRDIAQRARHIPFAQHSAASLAGKKIDGQTYIACLSESPCHILDMRSKSAVLMTDQDNWRRGFVGWTSQIAQQDRIWCLDFHIAGNDRRVVRHHSSMRSGGRCFCRDRFSRR